jgi:hypothetical protein
MKQSSSISSSRIQLKPTNESAPKHVKKTAYHAVSRIHQSTRLIFVTVTSLIGRALSSRATERGRIFVQLKCICNFFDGRSRRSSLGGVFAMLSSWCTGSTSAEQHKHWPCHRQSWLQHRTVEGC